MAAPPVSTSRASPPTCCGKPPIAADRFRFFAAIDWSGAAGPRQRGIAVAICEGGSRSAPQLVGADRIWSRQEVLTWLSNEMPTGTLVGLDLGLSLPFIDRDAFFPGWPESPPGALALWALVDRLCTDDPHLGANSFVDHIEASRHFRRHGGRKGEYFAGRGRLRETERSQQAQGLNPYSNFNLVGAAQVGKSSLTGMRVLHRLNGALPVWPFGPPGDAGSVIVEIYTSVAALAGGRPRGRTKMTSIEALNEALAAPAIGSERVAGTGPIDDHRSDALLTAAWLRAVAHRPELWSPAAMTPQIARTEGWTFGVT